MIASCDGFIKSEDGRGGEIRTHDLLNPIQARHRAAARTEHPAWRSKPDVQQADNGGGAFQELVWAVKEPSRFAVGGAGELYLVRATKR